MRVIVLGGTGQIGRPLVAALAARGDEVIVLSRRPPAAPALPPGARYEAWDGESPRGWGPLVAGAALINLAGDNLAEGRWTAAKKQRIRASRLASGRAVVAAVEAAAERPVALLQASAVGYYGAGEAEVDEQSPPGEGFLAETCVAWEESTAAVATMGVRRALLRTGLVLSRDGGALPKLVLPFRLFAGGPVGSGRQWLPWIHEADEVAAILALLDAPAAAGPFNLCAPEPVRQAEMARQIGAVLGRPSWLPAPAFALRLALGEMSQLALEGQRALPRRLSELGFPYRFASLAAALEDLLA